MKRLTLFLAALLLSSCASAPMPGALTGDDSPFHKLLTSILSGKVSLADTRIEGVTAGGQSVAEAIVASQKPGFEGVVALVLGSKAYKAGWVLRVIPQGQTEALDIICAPKQAEKCATFGPNVPIVVYASPVPVQSGLFFVRRISD
jgi:hypothetical protein